MRIAVVISNPKKKVGLGNQQIRKYFWNNRPLTLVVNELAIPD